MKSTVLFAILLGISLGCNKKEKSVVIKGDPENGNSYFAEFYKGKEYTFTAEKSRKKGGFWYLDDEYIGTGKEIKVVFRTFFNNRLTYRESKSTLSGKEKILVEADYNLIITGNGRDYVSNWIGSNTYGIHPEFNKCSVTERPDSDSLTFLLFDSLSPNAYWKIIVIPYSTTNISFTGEMEYKYPNNSGILNVSGLLEIIDEDRLSAKIQSPEGSFFTTYYR